MKNQESPVFFDQKSASSYDEKWAKIAPTRDALHFLIRFILSELPEDANILCVGAGTGLELIDLAQNFPRWRFTAVEPAAPMLEICRRRAEENGIATRCAFHEGYLDSLPASTSFDAATCLLVSQFLVQKEERRDFFSQIAQRLCPNGYLVSCDLASDVSTAAYQNLLDVWKRMMKYTGVSDQNVEKMSAAYGRDVAVLPPAEIEAIIAAAGFDAPVLFFQNLLFHAWHARRRASD